MDWVANVSVFSVTSCEIATQRSEANLARILRSLDTKTQMGPLNFVEWNHKGMVTFINGAFSFSWIHCFAENVKKIIKQIKLEKP